MSRARPGDTISLSLEGGTPRGRFGFRTRRPVRPHSGFDRAERVRACGRRRSRRASLRRRRGCCAPPSEGRRSRACSSRTSRRTSDVEVEDRPARFESLLAWTERSLNDLPGSKRLSSELERSGLNLRLGHLPSRAGRRLRLRDGQHDRRCTTSALLLMLVGLAAPFAALRVAARRPDEGIRRATARRPRHDRVASSRARAADGAEGDRRRRRTAGIAGVRSRARRGASRSAARSGDRRHVRSGSARRTSSTSRPQSTSRPGPAARSRVSSTRCRRPFEKQRHARKVHALTSLGRISAIALVGMPIALGALMTIISPSYMTPLFTTSGGHV